MELPLQPTTVAGIDLGSNSFHMIVVRSNQGGKIEVLDKLREPVRLAAGLDEEGNLDPAAMKRGWSALERMGERLRDLPRDRVRAVGTNTLRKAKNGASFLERGQQLLGHPVQIISGSEEARLIFEGVTHSDFIPSGRRFVMDIGGGSTEFIIGRGFSAEMTHSLFMGCVSYSKRFFGDERMTYAHFDAAELAAAKELRSIRESFRQSGWDHAFGASGTIRSVAQVLREKGWTTGDVTLAGLDALVDSMVAQKRVSRLSLEGLDPDRAPVFPGGVSVLRASFRSLGITRLQAATGALREGLAWELLGRTENRDIREDTVQAFVERYAVDVRHAKRVRETAYALLEQVREVWSLDPVVARRFLGWAAELHEIGISIAYTGYHKHDAYILQNATMPGFSRDEQSTLASVLRGHRRKLRRKFYKDLPRKTGVFALGLTVLLRLAAVLHRSRTEESLPPICVETPKRERLRLCFPPGWLEQHPLVQADLEGEREYLNPVGVQLEFA
ncbi:MAG: exopolyphosphatase [Myxococcota bacterium]